jgi:hypothetical protein
VSVPLQSVPDEDQQDDEVETAVITQAKQQAIEIIASARREAEAIVAEARTTVPDASPLAALGDNAEEIIGQVRKLIKQQRELQTQRAAMEEEIADLKTERDELVQRLTDAVVRMEELAVLADGAEPSPTWTPPAAAAPPPPDTPPPHNEVVIDPDEEDTSLAARLERAEREAQAPNNESPSLAARLAAAEREEAAIDDGEHGFADDEAPYIVGADGRSFYSRHSAKLPRLEGDGGRSVLSAVGGMRPEPEPKGRKSRRRKKDR